MSVHSIESSPELIAIVWNSVDDGRPRVSWLGVDASGELTLESEVDICTECREAIGETASEEVYTASQVASTNDESLLLAGPCGAIGIVEVDSGGHCELHVLTDEVDGFVRSIDPLAVMTTEEGYVALWSEGQHLWMTALTSRLERGDSRRLWFSETTMTREYPTSVCLPTSASRTECVVLWTERTVGIPGEAPAEGDTRLAWDVGQPSQTGEVLSWEQLRRELNEGYSGRFVISPESLEECLRPTGCVGLFVFRHSSQGLLVRYWIAGSDENPEMDPHVSPLAFNDHVVQLVDGEEITEPAITPIHGPSFVVGWVARRAFEQPREMSLVMVGAQREARRVVTSAVVVPGFSRLELDVEHGPRLALHPPLLARSPGEDAKLLIGAVVEEGLEDAHGCALQVTVASLPPEDELPPEGAWPFSVELPMEVEPLAISVPGACEPGCGGEAAWVEDRFVITLPSDAGLRIFTVTEGEGETWEMEEVATLMDEEAAGFPLCNISTRVGSLSDENELLIAAGFHGEVSGQGIRVWRGMLGGERWNFDEVSTEDVADGSARDPIFAAGPDSTPLLLWSTKPFDGSQQQDVGVGIVRERELADAEFPYGELVDASLNSAFGVPVPCDGDGTAEGDNLCAVIAVGRLDPAMEDTGFGLFTEARRTPVLNTLTAQLFVENEDCPDCGELAMPVGGFDENWHGLPVELTWWGSSPLTIVNAMALHEWEAGEAVLFEIESAEDGHFWNAWEMESRWLSGEEHMGQYAPALRLAGSDERRGGVWSRRGWVDGELYTVEYHFSLLENRAGGVELASASVMIDERTNADPEVVWAARDGRTSMLDILDNGIAVLGDDGGYVVAWVGDLGVNAARVTCEVVESRQLEP